jgi:hypothetical protein
VRRVCRDVPRLQRWSVSLRRTAAASLVLLSASVAIFLPKGLPLASVLQAASFSIPSTRCLGPRATRGLVGLDAFTLFSLSLAAGHRSLGLANRSKLVNLRLGSFDRFSCLLRHRSRHHSWRRRRTDSAESSRSPARPRRGRPCSARSARGSAPTIDCPRHARGTRRTRVRRRLLPPDLDPAHHPARNNERS